MKAIAVWSRTAIVVFMLTTALLAEKPPALYTVKGNLALSGYDAVSYFAEGKPVLGKAEFSYEWMGATWRFSSAANRDAFKENPEKYTPQYGGYCAFGTSQGHLVPGDPQAWKIVDDKLYLNYNKQVQGFWIEDIPGNIKKADENYPNLHK